MNRVIKWSNGNPGAMMFLTILFTSDGNKIHENILNKLETLKSIRGTNLYVLWSDLCNKDLGCVNKLINNCPSTILEDACSRQDYSGIGLIAKYLTD